MKRTRLINPIFIIAVLIACANNRQGEEGKLLQNSQRTPFHDSLEKGKLIPLVRCNQDSEQTYAVYIPLTAGRQSPTILYFFDPHGNGSLPLKKYQAIADRTGWIMIGSNNSKNGNDWAAAEKIIQTLFEDSQKRLSLTSALVYTCGFSGGGKVASYAAFRREEIKGVIAIGGALPDVADTGHYAFSFTAIAGKGDMNMTELVDIDRQLNFKKMTHRLFLFDGIHEWAPESTMLDAITCLQLDAMNKGWIKKDTVLTRDFVQDAVNRISIFEKKGELLRAGEEYSILEGLARSGSIPDGEALMKRYSELRSDPVYERQVKNHEHWLVTETVWKNEFMKKFGELDQGFWNETIPKLKSGARQTGEEGAMNQRLLAYLSLAFYSISNQLIPVNRNEEAAFFVDLYKKVDSVNSEAWYLSAILNARRGNKPGATRDLEKAITCGFTERSRLERQPEFSHIGIDVNSIGKSIKEP